jgi:hypothetical protein
MGIVLDRVGRWGGILADDWGCSLPGWLSCRLHKGGEVELWLGRLHLILTPPWLPAGKRMGNASLGREVWECCRLLRNAPAPHTPAAGDGMKRAA